MQTFDRNNVEALLTEVVRKRGEDYQYGKEAKYVGCTYERDGEPSCGIGVMLSDIGVPVPILKKLDSCSDSNINESATLSVLEVNGFTFTPGAVDFMYAFQRWQDQEEPYGKCMEMAKAGISDPFANTNTKPPF